MKNCYGYIRVSTVKQGEQGVSLQEQRAAIERYALRNSIAIVEWFEETLTAAKQGRPLFTRMMKRLRAGEAHGVVIHKIDRSTRNLRDWADLGDLIDAGVAVYFANESVDLQSRGGRLSADIQAVVAADFIRNLREETRKGVFGRLKQGLYPFAAPLGYVDNGGGRPKTVDPLLGPLVKQAFELYSTGRYTLLSLSAVLRDRGIRNRQGGPVSLNGLSRILNNSFYAGLIRLESTGQTFEGIHEPLISMSLFTAVRNRLHGRAHKTQTKHAYRLRGLFRCSLCNRYLIGERQKGTVYYRCHTPECPTRCFREDALEDAMLSAWPPIAVTAGERTQLVAVLGCFSEQDENHSRTRADGIRIQLSAVANRLTRLTDALIDGSIDKAVFEERRSSLLEKKVSLEAALTSLPDERARLTAILTEALELAESAQRSYELGNDDDKRELAIRLCSNLTVSGKDVAVEPRFPLRAIAKRRLITEGDPHRGNSRTFGPREAWKLWSWYPRWLKRQQSVGSTKRYRY